MKLRALAVLIFCLGLFCLGQQPRAYWQSRDSNYNISISTSGCPASANFIARTSGLSGAETTAYQNMICGLVTDGVITGNLSGATGCGAGSFDGLYVLATNSTTSAALNLCGTSYPLTSHGSCTFTADRGYTGDASSCYQDSGFNANTAGGQMARNSASMAVCVLNSRVTSQSWVNIGGNDGSASSYQQSQNSGAVHYDLTGANFPTFTVADAQGSWIATRGGSTTVTLYQNGSSVATPADNSTQAVNSNVLLLAFNNSGTPILFSGDQIAYAFFGANFGAPAVGNIYSRFHTFLAAVGASAC